MTAEYCFSRRASRVTTSRAMVVTALIWIGTAALTRYSSVSALLATAAAPVALLLFGRPTMAVLVGVLTVMIWIRHRGNLKRLLAGQETRIGGT